MEQYVILEGRVHVRNRQEEDQTECGLFFDHHHIDPARADLGFCAECDRRHVRSIPLVIAQ